MKSISLYSNTEFSSNALELTKDDYLNNSILRFKIKDYDGAINDCTNAIKIDDKYLSAYLMRFTIRMELKEYSLAVGDFFHSVSLEENGSELNRSIKCHETLFDVFIQMPKEERTKFKEEIRKKTNASKTSEENEPNSHLNIVR